MIRGQNYLYTMYVKKMLASNCMCRHCWPYIDTNNLLVKGRHMQFDASIKLFEYWHEQVKIRKKRWNNKEIKKFYWK